MSYSGATQARTARESLGRALEALQQDPNIPSDVLAVAQNIAQAVGALFQAERAGTEPDGKNAIRAALGSLSQTLALLQDVRAQHPGIGTAAAAIASVMGLLYPLTSVPSQLPPTSATHEPHIPPAAAVPNVEAFAQAPTVAQSAQTVAQFVAPVPVAPTPVASPAPASTPPAAAVPAAAAATPSAPAPARVSSRPPPGPKPVFVPGKHPQVEANIGAHTESNFFVGFSGEISDGGVFVATYESYSKETPVRVLVTLPGGFEFQVDGHVRFVRDPMDFTADSEPGMGVQFHNLSAEARHLVLRFIQKRAPIFFDD